MHPEMIEGMRHGTSASVPRASQGEGEEEEVGEKPISDVGMDPSIRLPRQLLTVRNSKCRRTAISECPTTLRQGRCRHILYYYKLSLRNLAHLSTPTHGLHIPYTSGHH
jgi:hypothetical protein